ncbi:hypothetical protein LNP25_10800 [Klebsiella variicola subsp. variicola]|nr:hypothetical protein [Klebsiella variicola subsp. variicola]
MKCSSCSRSIFLGRWRKWRKPASSRPTGAPTSTTLAEMVVKTAHPGDHILVMSNGGFGGIHQMLLDKLAQKAAAAE